jgi:hypothetical protein
MGMMNINEYRVQQMKAEFIRKFRKERRKREAKMFAVLIMVAGASIAFFKWMGL